MNEELADLQAKMKAVQAKKAALRREEDAARKKARTATPANARGGQLAPIRDSEAAPSVRLIKQTRTNVLGAFKIDCY